MIDEPIWQQVKRYAANPLSHNQRREKRFQDLHQTLNEVAKAINPGAKEWQLDFGLDARLATKFRSYTFASENRISLSGSIGRLSYASWDSLEHEIVGEVAEIELQRRDNG